MNTIYEAAAIAPLSVDIPAEPPTGSVVPDRAGYAWQAFPFNEGETTAWYRVQSAFAMVGRHPHIEVWRHLIVDEGPLRLVHRAEATGD